METVSPKFLCGNENIVTGMFESEELPPNKNSDTDNDEVTMITYNTNEQLTQRSNILLYTFSHRPSIIPVEARRDLYLSKGHGSRDL